jgi:hypothetical protein
MLILSMDMPGGLATIILRCCFGPGSLHLILPQIAAHKPGAPMTREIWKVYYRTLRIAQREAAKAAVDAMIFGTGFVFVSNEGFINHIRPEAVSLEALGVHGQETR